MSPIFKYQSYCHASSVTRRFLFLLIIVLTLPGCDEEKIITLALESYSFKQGHNSQLDADCIGEINPTGDTVTLSVPYFIDVASLIADYEIAEGSSAYVNQVRQTSGVTVNDFTGIIDYVLSAGQEDEYRFSVKCINNLFLSACGYSEDSLRIGAGDFLKEVLFKISNIKNGNWEYTISLGKYSYFGTAESTANYFMLPNFLTEEQWLALNEGEDGELIFTVTLSSSENGVASEQFEFSLLREQYSIKSWQDLQAMGYDLLGDYKIYADIEFPYPGTDGFSPDGFEPVGDSLENSFKGSLDGQDHVIKNFYINRNNGQTRYVGLFGVIERRADILPVIKNLGIEISTREETGDITGGLYAGGIAGWNEGKIINCYVKGNVMSTGLSTEPGGSGGLVGINYGGKIDRCGSLGGKVESVICAGGLTSENTNEGEISRSWSGNYIVITGESGYGSQAVAAGGFAGKNTEGATIINSYSTGDVTGNEALGGFVGYHTNTSTIRTSYSTGNVIEVDADGSANIGGFIGEISGTEKRRSITDSYWNMAANPGYDGVGVGETYGVDGRSAREFENEVMYIGWDFSNTWAIQPGYNNGYAYLLKVNGQED
jgi:hypothetical protein